MGKVADRFFPQPDPSFFPAAAERLRVSLFTTLQLTVLLGLVYLYKFETANQVQQVLPLILAGFVIHELLPLRFRLPFFFLLGVASYFLVAGFLTGLVTLLMGLFFIGISHLPIKHFLKKALAVLIAILLGLVHLRILSFPLIHSAIPFLAAMFMFRWMIYLYEIRFEKTPLSIWQRLSYFFMLPNVCFPLFPIVDYKNFTRQYYDAAYAQIHHNAIKKIFRGVLHLVVYRFVYYYLVPSPTEVNDLSGLLQYITFSYLLILRLSGMFHLALGITGLFGFNLPEIFNNYLLASSFSDLWRRINIYWREFVVKIFYQPIFFKIKKQTGALALPITVLLVFGINWLLHNYQWFWLQGTIVRKANDVLFWALFGITVMFNSLYQAKKQAAGIASQDEKWNIKDSLSRILRIYGIFLFMSALWSLWCASSISEWAYLMSFANSVPREHFIFYLAGIPALLVLGVLCDRAVQSEKGGPFILWFTNPGPKAIVFYSLLLLTISIPAVYNKLPGGSGQLINRLQENKLNTPDKISMERGYYQKILSDDGKISREVWRSKDGKKKEWTTVNKATRTTHDLLMAELLPNTRVEFKGASISTNSWGMRDKEYSKEKKQGVYRIALLGGSYEMGSGIADGSNFESELESKLNGNFTGKENSAFEILNFAVGGYHIFQHVKVLEEKALAFDPDAVLYFAHSDEYYRASRKLAELVIGGNDLQYPFLEEVVKKAGLDASMSSLEIERKLKPFMPALVKWVYYRIADQCRKNGAKPVWVFLPAIDDPMAPEELKTISQMAENAGFLTLSLQDVYKNHILDSVKLSSWDNHPNVKGHQIIAGQLFERLVKKSGELNF